MITAIRQLPKNTKPSTPMRFWLALQAERGRVTAKIVANAVYEKKAQRQLSPESFMSRKLESNRLDLSFRQLPYLWQKPCPCRGVSSQQGRVGASNPPLFNEMLNLDDQYIFILSISSSCVFFTESWYSGWPGCLLTASQSAIQ